MLDQKAIDLEIAKIAEEIQGYLKKHPQSVDTADGVTNWWLLRQRYETAVEKVKKALDYLVDMGFLEKVERCGGKTLYKHVPNGSGKS
ncbi:MAG: hypothetical protein MI863_20355 [Desulfobacterales bacterium]|nr:hypothetical protein [Desulfobacterales bacterium]